MRAPFASEEAVPYSRLAVMTLRSWLHVPRFLASAPAAMATVRSRRASIKAWRPLES